MEPAALITDAPTLLARLPLCAALEQQLSLGGKLDFLREFVAIRDAVEGEYYAAADARTTPQQRALRFLKTMIDPLLGRKVQDAEQFYQTYGRLMRLAWLSISMGLYDAAIQQVPDVQQRLNLAQVNTVDVAWRPALHHLQHRQPSTGEPLLVEIGTGRGNSITRLARLLPHAKIISITISGEQHQLTSRLARKWNLHNVEVRLGDILSRELTSDLQGRADAVGAIEVTGHFPPERKIAGIGCFARLLKPGAPLSLLDSAALRPPSRFEQSYYANQSWHFGTRELYETALAEAGLRLAAYIDHSPSMRQTLRESAPVLARHRAQLRREFGTVMALVWPLVPWLNLLTVGKVGYVQILGYR